MNEITVKEMLEQRRTLKLAWAEPWKACGPDGNETESHIELSATVNDCINMSRAAAKQAGHPTTGDDERYLLDFIAVHWTVPANQECKSEIERLKMENAEAKCAMQNIANAFRMRVPVDAPFRELISVVEKVAMDKEMDDVIATEEYLIGDNDLD